MKTTRKPASTTQSDGAILDRISANPPLRTVLDNGLTVVTCEDFEADLVTVQVWVRTGSINEGPLLGSGVSHYLEHMLFKGTPTRSASAISNDIQATGGYVNAYTSFDRTVYYTEMPASAFATGVDVLADIVRNSTIDPAEVERERGVILREIAMGEDEPDHQVSQALFQTAFRQHPYRYPVIGLRDRFERLTREDLFQYYRSRYVPEKLTIVIVGAITTADMLAGVREHFGDFSAAAPVDMPIVPERPQFSPRTERLFGDVQLTRGAIAWRIPSLFDPSGPSIDVLASVLGGGQSSILWQRLREELRLVHDIDTFAWNPGETGLFWIGYLCDGDKRDAVESAILKELKRLPRCRDLNKRIERARRQAIVQEINSYKTVSGRAARIGSAEVVVGDLNYPRTYLKRLNSVNVAGVLAAAEAHLIPAGQLTTSLEPQERLIKKRKSASRTGRPPAFVEHTLSNGGRLLLQPFRSYPKVHLSVGVLGGRHYETDATAGVSCLAANLLTKDAGGRAGRKIMESLESHGIDFNDFSGDNAFGFRLEGLSDDLPLMVEAARDALLFADLRDDTLERERTAQIARIDEVQDDVVDLGRLKLRQSFFAGLPWHIDSLGTRDSVAALDRNAVSAYLKQRLVGEGVVVAVTGDFDPDAILEGLDDWFGQLPSGEAPLPPALPQGTLPGNPGSFEHPLQRKQTVVFQAYPSCGVTDAGGILVASIARELLSGLSSRLFQRIREELGLAYFVGASATVGLDAGMFALYSGIEKSAMSTVWQEFDAEIQRVRSGGYSDSEFDNCKTRMKAQRLMALQTIGARAGGRLLCSLYRYPANHWDTAEDRIDALQRDDLDAFTNKWLQPEKAVRLAIGDL